MRAPVIVVFGLTALAGPSGCAGSASSAPEASRAPTPLFADEFDGPAGQPPNPKHWVHDLGGNGWGNGELQAYTDRPENASLDGHGNLVITARREAVGAMQYTSARLKSAGRFERAYGHFEARIKLPVGQGIWPAFWMLGNDCQGAMCGDGDVRWPQVGEIDIMEYLGHQPGQVFGALHGPGYSGAASLHARYNLPAGQAFHQDFRVFAVDWEPERIRWSVDGVVYQTLSRQDVTARGDWVFDHPFYMLLNIAVGGGLPGPPDDTTEFPQRMLVDYVRVYARPAR